MGIITAHNDTIFEPSDKLFSKVKRRLKTYNQAGLLDSNDFYDYVMEVLNELGVGGLMEEQGILEICNGKAKLPINFKSLYAATICTATGSGNNPRLQNGYAFFTDTTYQDTIPGCSIDCAPQSTGTKVIVREYVQGLENIYNYDLGCPLTIITYTPHKNCDPNSIATYNGYVYTGFTSGSIYMKYYSYPIDCDTGLPLVPNVLSIQKAIEYKIIYESFLNWYLNDEVPGMERKAQEVKHLYTQAMSAASYESKLPSFMTMIDMIRTKRQSLDTYRQTGRQTYFND